MGDDDADPNRVGPLDYARPGRVRVRRRPMGRFERWAVFLLLSPIGGWITYGGICLRATGRSFAPGYWKHDDLVHAGWGIMAVGGLIIFVALRTLIRGRH